MSPQPPSCAASTHSIMPYLHRARRQAGGRWGAEGGERGCRAGAGVGGWAGAECAYTRHERQLLAAVAKTSLS